MNRIGIGIGNQKSRSLLAKDTFTDTNDTLINSHLMNIGNGWNNIQPTYATWAINNNQLKRTSKTTAVYSWVCTHIASPNYEISLDVLNGNNYECLALRINGDVYYQVYYGGGTLILREANNQTFTVKAQKTLALTNYKLKIICIGSSIVVFINGVEQIRYDGATLNLSSDYLGVFINASSATYDVVTFDNLEVVST